LDGTLRQLTIEKITQQQGKGRTSKVEV